MVSVPKKVYSYKVEKILGKELVHSSLVPEREHKISLQEQVSNWLLLRYCLGLAQGQHLPTQSTGSSYCDLVWSEDGIKLENIYEEI